MLTQQARRMDDPMQAKQLCVLIPSLEPDERLPVYVDALLAADFTPPSITNATDDLSQHYVYEFEDVGGLADG